MQNTNRSALYWAPRMLGLAAAIFLATFAFDVFGEGLAFGDLVVAFVIHLIPSMSILAVLAVAWRWERVGGMLFIVLGFFYVAMFWDPGRWMAYLIIAGPLFVTGGLFMLNHWIMRTEGAE